MGASTSSGTVRGTILARNIGSPNGNTVTADSTVSLTLNGDYDTISIQTVGTYTGALTVQVTLNGSDWIALGGTTALINVSTAATSATIASASQGIFQADVSGFAGVRVTALAAFTGSVAVTLQAGTGAGVMGVDTPIVLATGTSTVGSFTQVANATPGTTTTNLNSAASTNAANVKTTAGVLYTVSAHNTTAADKFVRFYNKASAPTVGTDIPMMVVRVPANQSKEASFGEGMRFSTGIGHAITGAASATDATAVAAGDVLLAYNWI